MPVEARILIVDDEAALRNVLSTSLAGIGFACSVARNGSEALEMLRDTAVDVLLLDINMPGMSGFEVCGRIRKSLPEVGIIMVTVRDFEHDKVQALEAGADDYMTKPYRLGELVARLRAVLRRTKLHQRAEPDTLQIGALEIDLQRRIVKRDGAEIHLSPKEFDVLAYLARHEGAPIVHARLLRAVWGPEYGCEVEYLRSYVKALRRKIEVNPAQPEYILTEPWVGYRFCNPTSPDSRPTPAE